MILCYYHLKEPLPHIIFQNIPKVIYHNLSNLLNKEYRNINQIKGNFYIKYNNNIINKYIIRKIKSFQRNIN